MTEDWKKKLSKQSSLEDVFFTSRRIYKKKGTHRLVLVGMSMFVFIFFLCCVFGIGGKEHYKDLGDFVFELSSLGFVLSITVLGFLIAGFAIFSSLSSPTLFLELAQTPYKKKVVISGKEIKEDTGITYAQHVFFNFINVFYVYISLLSVALVVLILFSQGSPFRALYSYFSDVYPDVSRAMKALVLVCFFMLFLECVLRLRSFIWNLYSWVVFVIFITDDDEKKRAENSEPS